MHRLAAPKRSSRTPAAKSAITTPSFWPAGAARPSSPLTTRIQGEAGERRRAALARAPGVEGGIWRQGEGSLAYAFPTYEGTGPKTDLPAAELETIRQINADALRGGLPVTLRQIGRSQVLAVNACPLRGPLNGVTAWAMTRVFTGQGPAYNQLLVGLAILALTVLGSAVWLGRILYGWSRKLMGLERALAAHDSQSADLPRLEPTGERELDRLVHALNATGARLADERRRASAAERLAAVGRVAAGLAHEIRNPIAAMRLKAENALAVDDQERRVAAMQSILQQIARLDGLLRDLLAMTQRREPKLAENDLAAFLERTADAHRELAASKGVKLVIGPAPAAATPRFDTEQMHRALDNLILNAIENTPTGGTIEVQAQHRDDCSSCFRYRAGRAAGHPRASVRALRHRTRRRNGPRAGHRARHCPRARRGGATCSDEPRCDFEIEVPWSRS